MHLKSIALQGFKTFAARTTLDLRPGITAIVGPNGSGKSNIADAVRWALGETNLRHVRCRATDELIFAGNARRSSLGLAEVSLVFANEGGWLGLPFNEVRVTRRANRSGANEYLLNGTRVRLRDIVDLLAGASIHAGGHVVVSQGLVDAVLALRPEERRPIIENLAGLNQYYLRRDEAEGRLQATEMNLLHVDAMIAELAPQMAALITQADALREHRAAVDELQRLQRLAFGAQAARLLERLSVVSSAASTSELELHSARDEAQQLRVEDDRLLAALAADRGQIDKLRGELDASRLTVEAARRDRDVAAARALSVEERASFARTDFQRVQDTRIAELAVLADARENALQLRTAAAGAEAALAERRRLAIDLEKSRDRAVAGARQAQARHTETARLATKAADAVATIRASIERLSADIERDEVAMTAAAIVLSDTRQAYAAAEGRLATQRMVEAEAQNAERAARDRLAASRTVAAAALSEHQHAERAAEQVSARCAVLQAWMQNLEGYGSGVRALAPRQGSSGIVSQQMRVAPAWREAIATALGARHDAILADDPGALFDAWQVRDGFGGRVQLVVLPHQARIDEFNTPRTGTRRTPAEGLALLLELRILAADEVVGWGCQVIEYPSGVTLDHALRLDCILLVTSVDAVLRSARYIAGLGIDVVSRDPAIAALSDGSVVFGLDESVAESIRRGEELVALELGKHEARAFEALTAARMSEAQQALHAAEQDVETARSECSQAESALARARDEARFQDRLVHQAEQTAASHDLLVARSRLELAERQSMLADDERRLEHARKIGEQFRMDADAANQAARRAEDSLAAAHAARRDDETALALLRDREWSASRLVDDQIRRLHMLDADLARHAEQERATKATIVELMRERDEAVARETAAMVNLDCQEAELNPVLERLRRHETAHGELRDTLRHAGDRLARADVAYERARRDADIVARDLEILRAQVSAELDCTLDDLPSGSPPLGAVSRVKSLRSTLAAIGSVNAHAEEDLHNTQQRLDFLHAQSADLRDGVARLRGMIADANATVRERFTRTVEELGEHFAHFFTRLFGGGSCKLIPEYDEHGQPTGVEIHAQPPGKRTRDLALLSGGERAMIAMALLFAMLRVRPVPFCLLDEVEAALDEANTGRFGAILRELSVGTQFILVTHNRGTMLHADRLYGITMSESGISTAASLALVGAGNSDDDAPGAVP